MKVLVKLRQRRLESWRKVAGSTYAEWLVKNEFATNRAAALVFAVGAPLAVAMLLTTGFIPEAWPYVLGIGSVLAVGVAVAWSIVSRRGSTLPTRVADDLWTRGFAVAGLPPVFRERDFLLWVLRNGATPDQLNAAALAPVVRDRPERTAGRTPVALKWSLALGLASTALLSFSVLLQAALVIGGQLTKGWAGELGSNPEVSGLVLLGIGAVFGGVVVSYTVFLVTRGSRAARSLVTWATLLFAIGVLAAVFLAPAYAFLAALGAAAWIACVALVWSPSANVYIRATGDVKRVLLDEVLARKRR